jgi:hypothetical protein
VAVALIHWAVNKGREGAGCIKNQMEARAAYAKAPKETGTSDNLEILANWVTSWRRKENGLGLLTEAASGAGREEALVEVGRTRPSTVEEGLERLH